MASSKVVAVLSIIYAVGLLCGWILGRHAGIPAWEADLPKKAAPQTPELTTACTSQPDVYLAAFEALYASSDVPFRSPADMEILNSTSRFVSGPALLRSVLSVARRAQAFGGLVASLAPSCVHLLYVYTRVDCSTTSALHVLSVGPSAGPIRGLVCNEPCEACDEATRVRRALKDRDVRCAASLDSLEAADYRRSLPDKHASTACVSQDERGNMWLVVPK